jgi:UDP-N-acetyl-D-galactosamine dehydrogenase
VVKELEEFGCNVDICDPWADAEEVRCEYGIEMKEYSSLDISDYDAVILAVAHNEFRNMSEKLFDKDKGEESGTVIYDIKGVVDKRLVDGRL